MENNITRAIVKELLSKSGFTAKKLLESYNEEFPDAKISPQTFSSKLSKETLRVKELAGIAKIVGCELRILPEGTMLVNNNEDTAVVTPVISNDEDNYLNSLTEKGQSIYVYCKDDETALNFLNDCEVDGFTFSDGKAPTEKKLVNLYRILPDKKICYAGFVGHMRWQSDNSSDIVKIEYNNFSSSRHELV